MRRVMGSNPMLELGVVQLNEPVDSDELCFYSPGASHALKLLRLFQLRDEPQPACYFFNRLENNMPHFVSYHFTNESEFEDSGHPQAIQPLIDEFHARR